MSPHFQADIQCGFHIDIKSRTANAGVPRPQEYSAMDQLSFSNIGRFELNV